LEEKFRSSQVGASIVSIIKNNFLVVSDYNWLPDNLEDSWIHKYTDNYLIYDKYHRDNWQESDKIIKQKNVGQNHYDMFDFIVTHYDNLPDVIIFCRACLFFPKGEKTSPTPERCASTGNYNENDFLKNCNNTTFTELHDFGPEAHQRYAHQAWPASKMAPDGGFLELNNSWYMNEGKYKYFNNLNSFFKDVYKNPILESYVRFSPGGNYIIPKKNILKYSKKFYRIIRDFMSHDIITAEIWMIERATYTIFTCDWEVNERYK
tara:strand:+ start:7114 stop:7902 length:789 start_codon:yes stop_codon:yes gene_type:complete